MALNLALSGNGKFSVVGGYPIALSSPRQTITEGILPLWATSVTATFKAVSGVTPGGDGEEPGTNTLTSADVHMAIYAMPTTSGADDGAPVALDTDGTIFQVDSLGVLNSSTSLTLTILSGANIDPVPHVFRLWVDGLSGTNGLEVYSIVVA